jgi:GxxExxY protein
MHPAYEKASGLTGSIIGSAIEVHRNKGLGLIESIYEWCLTKELELRGISFTSQKGVVIEYKGFKREEPLRYDILVEGCVLVEAKAVERILPIHKAKLLSYMKLLNVPIGLLLNFHEMRLIDGISRLILPGANQ